MVIFRCAANCLATATISSSISKVVRINRA
jgi:hypothetical protein